LLCLETSATCDLPERAGLLLRCDQRTYGTTMISLYAGADEKDMQP